MPINSHTRPREIKAMDDDDNNVGHGPPFRMTPTNGSANSRDLRFVFHDGKSKCYSLSAIYINNIEPLIQSNKIVVRNFF